MSDSSAAGPMRILVVDDDAAVVEYLCESLGARGYETLGLTSAQEALDRCLQDNFDLLLADVEMPVLRGVDLLRAVLQSKPTQQVLLITAYGSVELAVEAVRDGACGFLTKPFRIEDLVYEVERVWSERRRRREVVRLRSERSPAQPVPNLVAESAAMRRLLSDAARVARSNATVLVTGETGTGKSAVARFIHDRSPRHKQPFVQLNCAALPAAIAESELFGVRRGAYTDAREHRDGMFVAAGSGTLFLDEIAELSLEVQAKLLVALESKAIRPLGGGAPTPVNARVIAATNGHLESLLQEGKLRPDLYYRINVVRLEVPPLRERREDIVPLVDLFLARALEHHDRPMAGISASALKELERHSWPGNVRELANIIERAVAMADHDTILPEDLEMNTVDMPGRGGDLHSAFNSQLTLDELQRAYVQHVVDAQGGNKAAAAKLLGITRRTLYRKLDQ